MPNNLVTCFLPVFNAERFLPNWWGKNGPELKSVSAHLVVVDNGSTDRTLSIIESFDGLSIKLIRQPRNLGLEESFRTAKSHINSKYRLLLPADDWLAPGYLKQALSILETDNDIGVVYGKSYTADLVSGVTSERSRPIRNSGKYLESPFSAFTFHNFVTDISLYRSKDLDCETHSAEWFLPGNQATILRRGSVYYTGEPQCFSGKRPDQVSKEWTKSGQYFDYFEKMYRGFQCSNTLATYESVILYLIHHHFYSGEALLRGLEACLKAGHPYVKVGLARHMQDVIVGLGLALVDDLLIDPVSLKFRSKGRYGSVEDLRTLISRLDSSAKGVVRSGLAIRGCERLLQ